MIKKTDMAVGEYQKGNIKEALKIAKDFKIGLTKEEHKQIVLGYECMVHEGFYKQIGRDPKVEIGKGLRVFIEKIFVPYCERNKTDKEIENVWESLTDIPFDEDDEKELILADDWYVFGKGTSREDIWHWFDERHSKGVVWLMYGEMEEVANV